MDKVSGISNVHMQMSSMPTSRVSEQSMPIWEREANIRGHYSSVSKAIQAHRDQVDERNSRHFNRGIEAAPRQYESQFVSSKAVQTEDTPVFKDSLVSAPENSYSSVNNVSAFDADLIEPVRSEAKGAAVNSFTTVDIDAPTVGEPVPKGSYLDVEA